MKKQTQRTIGILLAIVLAGSAVTAWWFWGRQKPLPEGLIQANGRIEGDHYTVPAKWRVALSGYWRMKGTR